MKLGRHLGMWIALTILLIMVLALVEDTSRVRAQLELEVGSARTWLSESGVTHAMSKANHWYEAVFQRTGFDARVRKEAERKDRLLSTGPSNWWLNVQLICYRLFVRMALVMGLAVPLALVFAASLFDGLVMRRVKSYRFGVTNPISYNMASHIIVAAPVMPFAYFVSPLPVHFAVLACGVVALAAALNVAGANFVQTR